MKRLSIVIATAVWVSFSACDKKLDLKNPQGMVRIIFFLIDAKLKKYSLATMHLSAAATCLADQ